MLLDEFDAAAAAAIVDAAAMDGTAPLVSVEIRQLGGAVGRPDPNGGALSHIAAPYALYAVGSPMGPVTGTAIEERLGELRTAAAPWRSRRTYFNFADRDVDAADLYPGRNAERLAELRAALDPDGLFRSRHTI
jgi:hypothetical protein